MKKYRPPEKVTSPVRHWTLIKILKNSGDHGHALALGKWRDDNGIRTVLAMRWNGDKENDTMGNPQSSAKPTWFVIPDEYVEKILTDSQIKLWKTLK